jgi:ribose 5-phosphate isomerase B
MRIALGSDHAGLDLKNALMEHLSKAGHEVADQGTHERTSCDYPDFAKAVAREVLDGSAERGLLVCGTGQGMAMTVNKIPGIRAAVVSDTFSAKMTAAHNDARVLCLGQRVVGVGLAIEILEAWLATPFEGGRHAARVAKLEG